MEEELDVNKLLKALDNDKNEILLNHTHKSLREMNVSILKELPITKEKVFEYSDKLNNYIYIDELDDLRSGTYVRWIMIPNEENNIIELKPPVLYCNTKITDKGLVIICKNFRNMFFQIKLDECILFRKITDQENILLNAMDVLNAK